MKVYHNKFLSQLKEKDLKQMETFAREDEFDAIRRYIAEKLKTSKFTAPQRNDLENFFANVYNKATIVSGLGTVKYDFWCLNLIYLKVQDSTNLDMVATKND